MTNLQYLLMQAQYVLNETYKAALEDCFNYYVEKEINVLINSIKKDADKELINSIDTLTIEELRKEKLIYNQILKIVDQITN